MCGSLLLLFAVRGAFGVKEPNPPQWPDSVVIFDPSDDPSEAQYLINQVFLTQGGEEPSCNGQWSEDRYAFLFKPGRHHLDVKVGYYTSVMGLGLVPDDVQIDCVQSQNGDYNYTTGALNNFWRSAENFASPGKCTDQFPQCGDDACTVWSVSQAAPMRRVHLQGDLFVWQFTGGCCAGYASGGFLGDALVEGTISTGTQQQWFSRNAKGGNWSGGVWNAVWVGCENNDETRCDPYTSIDKTPVIAEKPFIHFDDDTGKYYLAVPPLEYDKKGPTEDWSDVALVDFEDVYVATEEDSAAEINAKLQSGLHLVLTPGNYNFSEPVVVDRAGTVVLGVGYPTLISTNGNAVLEVGDVAGVRIAAIMAQAGSVRSEALLRVGSTDGNYGGDPSNPTFLYDVFARVGGPNNSSAGDEVATDLMLQFNSGNVVYDNSWLWRADHDIGGLVSDSRNPVNTGLEVNGDNVICYGLASEHTLEDLVVWNGEKGTTYFYQSELPYDVTQENFGDKGYVGYRVTDKVKQHTGYGVGVYSYFRDYAVIVENGIMTGSSSKIKFTNSFSVFLNGKGEIEHVINDEGVASNSENSPAYVCDYNT